jgi:hypothetical protein
MELTTMPSGTSKAEGSIPADARPGRGQQGLDRMLIPGEVGH